MITDAFDDQILNLIMTLSALVLEYQFLEFNSTYWRHIRGTSMGSNFFVVYACLFLCFLENLQQQTCKPEELIFYKRYIDDVFGLWIGTQDNLLHYLKGYAPGLQQHITWVPLLAWIS